MNINEVLIIDDKEVAIFKSRRMDPNYIVVSYLYKHEYYHNITISLRTHKIDRTRLFRKDIKHIQSFNEFQQSYPEYFI